MPAVDVGTGTTVTFLTSGFAAHVTALRLSSLTRRALERSHMGTPAPPVGTFGNRTFLAHRLSHAGQIVLDVHFDAQQPVPIDGPVETIHIDWPLAPGAMASTRWTCTGFVVGLDVTDSFDDLMTATLTVHLSSVVATTVPATGCARLLAAGLGAGMLACFDLDEATGARLDHLGGQVLVPTGGVTQVPGKVQYAAQCNGVDALLYAGSTPLEFSPPFTLACWVKLDAYPESSANACLVGRGDDLFSNTYNFYLIIRGDSQRYQCSVGGGFRNVVEYGAVAALGAWQLVVIWHDGDAATTGTLSMQVDNGAIASHADFSLFEGSAYDAFTLGAMGAPPGARHAHAALDQVLLWNRALTLQSERDILWNDGNG